jgi:hypothetical protein
MRVLTCSATRRRLEALHDEELPVSEQVWVNAHLDWCDACASKLTELRVMRSAIRSGVLDRGVLSSEEEISLRAAVINRVKAEETVSLAATARDMLQDMHFVYAGIAAAVAATVTLVIAVGMMRAATMQPGTLSEMVMGLESGANWNPMYVSVRMQMPRAVGERFSTGTVSESGDAEVALAAVVTREGRVASLELLRNHGTPRIAPGNDEATTVGEMLVAASEARFQPASVSGLPVAVNVVWIVAHTTVRASRELPPLQIPRRRAADFFLPPAARPTLT